ncbi:unnamed protein product [Discula destructiva]
MTVRRLVEEFQLVRTDVGFSQDLDHFVFLVPFSGPTAQSEWNFRRVLAPQLIPENPQSANLFKYAFNSVKKAFVVFDVFLADDDGDRFTDMRLWQMLQDSWMATGNCEASLRYVAFHYIVNEAVRDLISEEWEYQVRSRASGGGGQREYGTSRQRMLTITGDNSPTWARNVFIRSGVRLAESLCTAEKILTCEKVHLIRRDETLMYMVLEFKNGGQDQENYREGLLHQAATMVEYNLLQKQAARAAGEEWESVVFIPPGTFLENTGRKST